MMYVCIYIYEIISLRTFSTHKPSMLSQMDVLRSYERYSMLSGSFPSHSETQHQAQHLTPHILCLRGDMIV